MLPGQLSFAPRHPARSVIIFGMGDCPRCAAPAEPVPWHESSSLWDTGTIRMRCVLDHWSLADA